MEPSFIKQIIDLGAFAVLAALVLLTFFYMIPKVMKELGEMRNGFAHDLREQRLEFLKELSEQRQVHARQTDRLAEAISALRDVMLGRGKKD